MNQGLVKIPGHETLIEELKNLQMQTSGKRVDHPKNKDSAIMGRGKISKDLVDCIAVVNWHIAGQEASFARETYDEASGQGAGTGGGVKNIETRGVSNRSRWSSFR